MEIIQQLIDGIRDRLKSTFIFSYIVIWCSFNWRFVYITVFMNSDYFKEISQLEYLVNLENFEFKWAWPLFFALVTSVVLPAINSVIQFLTEYISKTRDHLILNKIYKKIPPTARQYARQFKKAKRLEEENDILTFDKKTLEKTIENSNEQVKLMQNEIDSNNSKHKIQIETLKKDNDDLKATIEVTSIQLTNLTNSSKVPDRFLDRNFLLVPHSQTYLYNKSLSNAQFLNKINNLSSIEKEEMIVISLTPNEIFIRPFLNVLPNDQTQIRFVKNNNKSLFVFSETKGTNFYISFENIFSNNDNIFEIRSNYTNKYKNSMMEFGLAILEQ